MSLGVAWSFCVASVLSIAVFPALTHASIDTDLQYSAHGAKVVELQTKLIAGGYLSGAPTGNFYTLTKNAVIAFQRAHGLPATGYVGALTRAAINKDAGATAATSATTTDDTVTALNAQLQSLTQLISQLSKGTAIATSSIQQAFATSTAAAIQYDPKWSTAIVNLYCMGRYDQSLSSGTGVMIDPRGVILTNAHVGFDELFAHWPDPSLQDCYVRTGSPAVNTYRATLLYIPDKWVNDSINDAFLYNATTTIGEKDYALLVVTGTADPAGHVPTSFPYMPMYTGKTLPVRTPVVHMGYAAEHSSYEDVLRSLYLLSSYANVDAQRGMGSSTVADVMAFSGAITSQHGVSGGAVVTGDGQVAGLMTYLDKDYGNKDATSQRVLNAISTDYILRDFEKDNGMSLTAFLSGKDLIAAAKKFDTDAQKYRSAYIKAIESKGYFVSGVSGAQY